MRDSRFKILWATALLCIGLLAGTTAGAAHEIPVDVTIRLIIAPDGDRLRVFVRVPLEAMRDFDFPLRGAGYLDIEPARAMLPDAATLWIADYVEFFEDGRSLGEEQLLATRLSLPSDPSFSALERITAHMQGDPFPASTDIPWKQVMFDVAFELPIDSDSADFSLRPEFAHLGLSTSTVIEFVPQQSASRLFQFTGNPGLVRLDPRWYHAAFRFVRLGFTHILDGIDHLLFLLCLVIPFRRFWALVPVVTSFTFAHSITLVASALGVVPSGLWFPPLIETLIALSIVYMALENVVGAKLERRWVIAFFFGLVHGFGFSFALSETLQFAGAHLITSLLAFNVGVELGQLLVLLVTLPLLAWFFRRVPDRVGTIVLSALVAHTAWHWMTERWADLSQFPRSWPAVTSWAPADVFRWLILLAIASGTLWLVRGPFDRWSGTAPPSSGDVR